MLCFKTRQYFKTHTNDTYFQFTNSIVVHITFVEFYAAYEKDFDLFYLESTQNAGTAMHKILMITH